MSNMGVANRLQIPFEMFLHIDVFLHLTHFYFHINVVILLFLTPQSEWKPGYAREVQHKFPEYYVLYIVSPLLTQSCTHRSLFLFLN